MMWHSSGFAAQFSGDNAEGQGQFTLCYGRTVAGDIQNAQVGPSGQSLDEFVQYRHILWYHVANL